ncbi:hypothetical protein [Falsiroseomonas tokyonensis]|uniref:Uncharacterized protein n=1 Tax=Falsiroseomonas tokyonensis TaxID=430521 RepID=A0ABV7BZU0_9PROT|nr:hypothetical protein [Falsiroseomonas tokyonensis]MBU8540772.1 hypothetical protein [Falsiroseomonas tokyonensis]
MKRLLFTGFGLALLPAIAQARPCAEVLTLGVPFQERVAVGPSSPPTFLWKVTARNFTSTRQTMQIWLTGINNVTNPVDAARRQLLSPNGEITIALGRISGPQPTVGEMQAGIRTTCQG